MRNILAILFGLMLASGALADDQAANLDKDQDGLISREEAAADPSLAENFDELDADGDGYLSPDELNGAASE